MVMNFKCLSHFRSKRLQWGPYSCLAEIIDFWIGQQEIGWLCCTAGSEPISVGLVPLITAVQERGTRQCETRGKLNPLTGLVSALPPPCRGLMNFSWICLILRVCRYGCRRLCWCHFQWPLGVVRKVYSELSQREMTELEVHSKYTES